MPCSGLAIIIILKYIYFVNKFILVLKWVCGEQGGAVPSKSKLCHFKFGMIIEYLRHH